MNYHSPIILATALFSFSGILPAATILDDFLVSQTVVVDGAPPTTGESLAAAPSALGGTRELLVTKVGGDVGDDVRVRTNPNGNARLTFSQDSDVNSTARLTYDGTADGSLNVSGLGGLDLWTSHSGVEATVAFSDLGGPLRFRVFDSSDGSGATFAQGILVIPGGVPSASAFDLQLPFVSFTSSNATSTADILQRVGAIQVTIDATGAAQSGWDVNLRQLRLTSASVPEPGFTLPFLTIAIFTICLRRRKLSADALRRKSGQCVAVVSVFMFGMDDSQGTNVLLDNFVSVQDLTVSAAAPATGQSGTAIATTAIGGARDIFVQKTFGDLDDVIRVRTNSNGQTRLTSSFDADVNGLVRITYDGNANGTLEANGLGGLDITGAGTNDSFQTIVSFSDLSGPLQITVFDNADGTGNTFASGTVSIPSGIPSNSNVMLTLPFTSMTPSNATSVNDVLANAGAVQFTIDATAGTQTGWDLNMRSLEAIPEPGTISLLALGLFMVMNRKR